MPSILPRRTPLVLLLFFLAAILVWTENKAHWTARGLLQPQAATKARSGRDLLCQWDEKRGKRNLFLAERPLGGAGEERERTAATSSPIKCASAFYDAWNNGDASLAASLCAENVEFWDANNPEPFRGRKAVKAYLQDCVDALSGWKFVIDDYAQDLERNKLGLYWHVSNRRGGSLPFPTRGLSFMEFDSAGLILSCTDIPEPTVKAGPIQLPMLKLVSRALRI